MFDLNEGMTMETVWDDIQHFFRISARIVFVAVAVIAIMGTLGSINDLIWPIRQ